MPALERVASVVNSSAVRDVTDEHDTTARLWRTSGTIVFGLGCGTQGDGRQRSVSIT